MTEVTCSIAAYLVRLAHDVHGVQLFGPAADVTRPVHPEIGLAERARIAAVPLITGRIDLAEVPASSAALAAPGDQVKVLIEPGRA